MHPLSLGALVGLRLDTSGAEVVRALVEGITYEARCITEQFADLGLPIDELRAIGGAAESDEWLQLKADIFQVPVTRPQVPESAALGAG